MPKPIVCLSDELRQFMAAFRVCFSKRQWKYFVLGLIECEERKTMTGLLRVVGERVSLSGFSRFLNKWPWSPEEQRALAAEKGLTCGDIRRRIQDEHRQNLLYWLQAQFQAGVTVEEIGIRLTPSSS